jgi:hypothetical protein
MKVVKLKKEDIVDWRSNVSHLVDEEGHLRAKLERPLENALAQVVRSARSQRKSLSQRVSIGSGANVREHTIAVSVTRAGLDANDLSLTPTIDGHRVVSGRDVVCARMLQEHGECQLRLQNGVILKVVRNPETHRPSFAESQQIAPKPEHCPCRTWGHPHPGTHFSTCQWNRLAPPAEQAPTDKLAEEEVRMLPTEAFAGLRPRVPVVPQTNPIAARVDPRAVVTEAAQLDAPESCRNACLEWATPPGYPIAPGQHHPTCNFYKGWMLKTAREIPRWLVDLRTGEKVRIATDGEIGEADIAAQRTGSPLIHIEEVQYAVVLETLLNVASPAPEPSARVLPPLPPPLAATGTSP